MSPPEREPTPPRLARLLVSWLAPPEDRDFLLDDLDARFRRVAKAEGRGPARRWYRSQALRSIPTLIGSALRDVGRVGLSGVGREAGRVVGASFRRPLYALGVSGTLAIGLGSMAVLGTLAWGIWLSPLPIPDPERVVRIYELGRVDDETGGRARNRISPPLLEDLRASELGTVQAVAGISGDSPDWTRGEDRRQLSALRVSPEYVAILGLRPRVGNLAWTSDQAAEVILSAGFWERAFGADPEVVGRTLELDGRPHRVIGVTALPAGYPGDRDLILPLAFDEQNLSEGMRGARYLEVIARVTPGSDAVAASHELAAFVASLGPDHPQHAGWSAEAVVLADDLTAPFRPVLALLLGAGLAFLALAVVNVVGLVAARRVEQRQEQAVRRALGASTGRLMRATVVESLVLGGVGAGVGVGFGWLVLPLVVSGLPTDISRIETVALTPGVALTLLATGLAASVGIGVAGHLMTGRRPGSLNATRAVSPRLGGRRVLVVGQVALTTLLLGSGLIMTREALDLRAVDLGFEAGGVEAGMVFLPSATYPDGPSRLGMWEGILTGLADGGLRAAVATNPSLAGSTMNYGFVPEGASDQVFGQYHAVSADYFDLLSIGITAGRDFEPGEEGPVVIVNERVAAEHFAGVDPVGRTVRLLNVDRVIVGVVQATRHFGPDQPAPFEIYVPLREDAWSFAHVLVEGSPDASGRIASVMGALDPALEPPDLAPYSDFVSEWFAPIRLQVGVIGMLSLIGAMLAGLGLYAVVAWHVRSRTREIGIRRALGAPSGGVFLRVVGQGLAMALVGAVGGVAIWMLTWERIAGILAVDHSPSLGMGLQVAALVAALAALACLIPALRSTRVDLLESMRVD